jgi:nicotinate-nucleotide adenylyltransferase
MSSDRSRRLGLLGGTFDPIHYGHLDAAAAAREALALDEIRLLPSHDPPHKPADPRATAFHRFALVALAIDGLDGYSTSDAELLRQGPSYTIETLGSLHREGWQARQIFFILGSDAFAEIASWHAFPEVLDAAHFVVIARPGMGLDAALQRVPALRARVCRAADARVETGANTVIIPVEAHTRDVSSTTIRARIAAGEPLDDLVPPAVARHIRAHHLYGAVDELHGQDTRNRQGV